MSLAWINRPVFVLAGIALVFNMGMFLKQRTGPERAANQRTNSLSELEARLGNVYKMLEDLGLKQEAMHKMLENRGRSRKAVEAKRQLQHQKQPEQSEHPEQKDHPEQKEHPVQPEQPEQKIPNASRAVKSPQLFPDSPLFKQWGQNLSEVEQREAEALFQKYGYNAFLSDRPPLDRVLSDTLDPRCLTKTYAKDLPSLGVVLIYLNEARSVIKRALRSIIDLTPKSILKEMILVDDGSSHEDLKGDLDAYVESLKRGNPTLNVTRVRHRKQRGLASARVAGWRAATAEVVAIPDEHPNHVTPLVQGKTET
ncbi:probable polypeptide N-acetylgalactosaminyltransferase 8 [Platichthys flesus]|uniref:probable polypeptide N-acetylgalactosaminyltransferase 8 n=1 Tax=Platichthys flesus TaxID=8260 RepID=UPI002DBE2763|nr:probable polypeptide N-acetylgalactosaminyltransferase 8 [Platichthys flesus]